MGRPATGQTPVTGVRLPKPLRARLEEIAAAEGRSISDLLIEAAHDLARKKEREQRAQGEPLGGAD